MIIRYIITGSYLDDDISVERIEYENIEEWHSEERTTDLFEFSIDLSQEQFDNLKIKIVGV